MKRLPLANPLCAKKEPRAWAESVKTAVMEMVRGE